MSTRHVSTAPSSILLYKHTIEPCLFLSVCLDSRVFFTLWGNIPSDRSDSSVSWKFNQSNTLNFSLICDACVCEVCLKRSCFLVWRYVFVCVGVTFDIQQGSEGSRSSPGLSGVVRSLIVSKRHPTQTVVPPDCTRITCTDSSSPAQRSPATVDCCIPRREGVSGVQLAQRGVWAQSRLYRQRVDVTQLACGLIQLMCWQCE